MKSHAIKTGLLAAASVAGLAIAVLGSSMAHATTIVSTPGVNAIVDEDSTARAVYFPNGSLGFKNGPYPATLNSRVPVPVGSYNKGDVYLRWMAVRFADTGADSQVVLRLMEMDYSSGAVTEKAVFDSNSYTATPPGLTSSMVWKSLGCGIYMYPWNTYWYEVTQTRNAAGSNVKSAFFEVMTETGPAGCAAAQGQPQPAPHGHM